MVDLRRTHAVRAGATLGSALEALGAAGGDVPSGTRLTLAWSADGVELSRHGVVLLTLGWADVTRVDTGTAEAGPYRGRVLRLSARQGGHLDLLPSYRLRGRLPATSGRVEDLAVELRDVRKAAVPPPPPRPLPCAHRARVIVPSDDDDDRRPVDVELSTALLLASRWGRDLRLQPDERPGAVDVPWTREELGAAVSHILGEAGRASLRPGAGVVEDASRMCSHLADLYPALATDALDAFRHQYCFENR